MSVYVKASLSLVGLACALYLVAVALFLAGGAQ